MSMNKQETIAYVGTAFLTFVVIVGIYLRIGEVRPLVLSNQITIEQNQKIIRENQETISILAQWMQSRGDATPADVQESVENLIEFLVYSSKLTLTQEDWEVLKTKYPELIKSDFNVELK